MTSKDVAQLRELYPIFLGFGAAQLLVSIIVRDSQLAIAGAILVFASIYGIEKSNETR